MGPVPIMRIEIEGMRHALHTMLGEHSQLLNEELQKAVDAFVTPDNISRVIQESARTQLKAATEAAVADFFRYGAGRDKLKGAIQAHLAELGLADPAEFSTADLSRMLLWLQDSANTPDTGDFVLAKKIYEKLGVPVPAAIMEKLA